MKVKEIRPAGYADVFNMEVEETHDFAVESGVIVHNCYDELRYVCMRNPIAPRRRAPDKPRPYDPLELEESNTYNKYDFYRRY